MRMRQEKGGLCLGLRPRGGIRHLASERWRKALPPNTQSGKGKGKGKEKSIIQHSLFDETLLPEISLKKQN